MKSEWLNMLLRLALFSAFMPLTVGAQDTARRSMMVGATATSFAYPQSVFVDATAGHIWVSDFDNHRVLRFDVSALTSVTGSQAADIPASNVIHQNYPNPFNPETVIRYGLRFTGHISLKVFDVLGREVAVLVDRTMPAGAHSVRFNARHLPGGIYVVALRSAPGVSVRTICMVK